MARYRKISPHIHNDQKFRTCTDDAKLLLFVVLTHPHLTALGAMRATPAGLAAELAWSEPRLRKALGQLTEHGMLEVDEGASFIAAPNFLKHNEPEGPNSVIKAWPAALELLPECRGKQLLVMRCLAYLEGLSDAFRHAIPDAIWDAFRDAILDARPDPSPIQEQELEPEPEQEPETPQSPPGGEGTRQSDERFEREFWSVYPHRNGVKKYRETALKKYRALPESEQRQLVLAVKHFACSPDARKGIGIPDAHRFIQAGPTRTPTFPWKDWLEPATQGGGHESRINSKDFRSGW